MLIGIDFDNTIACYDQGFLDVAKAMGLVPDDFTGGKKAIRDHVRLGPGGDMDWQRLQARLYGPDIHLARMMDGMERLLERLADASIPVVIVSHKTRTSPLDPSIDLRQAALGWMKANGLFDRFGIGRDRVYFESTRLGKIDRIRGLGCTHFIDDLEEVFADPSFPRSVRSYLFAPHEDPLPEGPFKAFTRHEQIADHMLGADPVRAADRLMDNRPSRISPGNTGGNNRIYQVMADDGQARMMKCYPAPDDDPRPRLETEWAALTFLAARDEPAVPLPLGLDMTGRAAIYQWIDGEQPLPPTEYDLDQALDFCTRLHAYRSAPGAASLPLASEACLSEAEILRQLDRRLARLTDVAEISGLIERITQARTLFGAGDDTELPMERRSLSPSDFGFHNALRRGNGTVIFLDFEYFGWDDPVKLTADTMLHPGFILSETQRRRFASGMAEIHADDSDFIDRLRRFAPLYVLRWSLILLNEFLPERMARRMTAGQIDANTLRARQLAKAETMFSRFHSIQKDMP